MNFPTIKGKCGDEAHKDWFMFESYSFGFHNELKSMSSDTKHPGSFDAITVIRTFDEASTQLTGVVTAKNVGTCVLQISKSGAESSQPFVTMTLTDAQIISYHVDANLTEGSLKEMISIHYSKIKIDYDPTSNKNKQKPGYSFECQLNN